MLQGTWPPFDLECVAPSEDLLSLLRRSELDDLVTYDYTHKGAWTKKDSSFVFGLAARLLKSAFLYGTWVVERHTKAPIDFSGVDAYLIGQLGEQYLVASNMPLTVNEAAHAVNSTSIFN